MPVPIVNDSHVAEALRLPTSMFRDRTTIKAILTVIVKQLQQLENATWEVINKRLLENASGVQLDTLGALVGEDREGRSDEDYLEGIKLRQLINRSTGKVSELIQIMQIAADGNPCFYRDHPPANYVIVFAGTEPALKALKRAVSEADPQGVSGMILHTSGVIEDLFTPGDFDGVTTLGGVGFGDSILGNIPGAFAHCVSTSKGDQ